MNKILCLIALLVLLPASFLVYAQSPRVDSLENLLRQHSRKDTVRVRLLNSTATALYLNNNERM